MESNFVFILCIKKKKIVRWKNKGKTSEKINCFGGKMEVLEKSIVVALNFQDFIG